MKEDMEVDLSKIAVSGVTSGCWVQKNIDIKHTVFNLPRPRGRIVSKRIYTSRGFP